MKTIIKLAIASALMLSLAACGTAQTKSLSDANMALKAAIAANSKAKKVKNEWKNTGKFIKKARKAKGKGNFDKAVKLAGIAERQAKNALAQSKAQRKAKPRY